MDIASAVAVERDTMVLVDDLLARFPPSRVGAREFLEAQFDAGLAWVHYPPGLGGHEAPESLQDIVDQRLAAAGAPARTGRHHLIGLGMLSPTLVRFAPAELAASWLRAMWSGAELWCELFSELEAGSDLAGVQTRAERVGDQWEITGQKVWTSLAHSARWGLLLARSQPGTQRQAGLSCFVCDLTAPGVRIEPIRQLTGQAEFNRVVLERVVIPDSHRLGFEGAGWQVVQHALLNDRATISLIADATGAGTAAHLLRLWQADPRHRRREDLYDRVVDVWLESEAIRQTVRAAHRDLAGGGAGFGALAAKIAVSRSWQQIAGLEMDILGAEGLRYDQWAFERPDLEAEDARPPAYRYLRSRGYTMEGGTSEVLLNTIAQRILGMPK